MAFVNQFQPLLFSEQSFKVLKVICQESGINETGFADFTSIDGLTFTGTSLAFNGVPIDAAAVTAEAILVNPFVGASSFISGGKVFNSFSILVNVRVNGTIITTTPLSIPITGQLECPCDIIATDTVQKHDVEFVGATVTGAVLPGVGPVVRVTATSRLCLVVARETIVRINAATPFCS